jgi:chorismate dehydratase
MCPLKKQRPAYLCYMNFNTQLPFTNSVIVPEKIIAGAVSYLNTKPLIYGFENGLMQQELELVIDYPSNIAASLLNNQIQVGLVPVAILPQMKEYYIVSDYCIACDGAVETVCIFSDVPINEVQQVLLDYQSRTSVLLTQYLLANFWQVNPTLQAAQPGYEQQVSGTTAALVIGDRAFAQKKKNKYCYDLGLAWQQHTGLPFVFAAWISNRPLPPDFIAAFNLACEYGLNHIEEVVKAYPHPGANLLNYYTRSIHYRLDAGKQKGLQYFLQQALPQQAFMPQVK